MTCPSSMDETGYSKPVHWVNSEGWKRREWEGSSVSGDTCAPVADPCQCMAKTTTIL